MHASHRPYIHYGLLALLFLVSATYHVLDISEGVGQLRHGREYVRPPFDVDLPHYTILAVKEEAVEAGLKAGDTIVRIGGQPLRYIGTDLWVPLRAARAGDRLAVEAMRVANGLPSTIRASVVLQPLRLGAPSPGYTALFVFFSVLLPIVCISLGFWVAVVRVRDGRAWLLLLLMLSIPAFAGGNMRFLFGRTDFFQPIAAAYQALLFNFWPTTLLLFAIYFPERLRLDRRLPWLKWLAIAPVVVHIVADNVVFQFIARRNPAAALGLHNVLQHGPFEPTWQYVLATYPLFVVGFFAILGYRTLTEREPDARRRLLLLDAGAVVSLVPMLIFLVFMVADRRDVIDRFVVPLFSLFLLFPVTMAYVIVVHRAMDVRVVVRQGVQYMLARGGIRVIQLALIVAVTHHRQLAAVRRGRLVRVALVAAGLAATVAIGGRFGDRLRGWVDRRFFREAYDAEQILSDLATQVRTMVETRPLLQTVAQRVAETLHVPRVAILLNEGGRLQPAYAVGYADVPQVAIPEDGLTVRRLQRDPHARVRFDDPDSWVHDLPDAERDIAGGVASRRAAAAVAQSESAWRAESRAEAIRGAVLEQRPAAAGIGRDADGPGTREQPADGGDRRADRRA